MIAWHYIIACIHSHRLLSMKRVILFIALCLLWSYTTAAAPIKVRFETNMGTFVVALYPDKAPKTVDNFMKYVQGGFYDGTIIHRVVRGFVIQGGGYTPDGTPKQTLPPIPNESDNGLSNLRGTIAMARTQDPDSATSQFYINTADNTRLDYQNGKPGYTVFGKVIEGMDVIDKIEQQPVAPDPNLGPHRPLEDIIIKRARRVLTPLNTWLNQ